MAIFLPVEILLRILEYSDAATLHNARQCSRTLEAAVDKTVAARKKKVTRCLAEFEASFNKISPSLLEDLEVSSTCAIKVNR